MSAEKFSFIPGIGSTQEAEPLKMTPQGAQFDYTFKAETYSGRKCVWYVNVATTNGGDGAVLWEDHNGDSVVEVNKYQGLFRVRLPKSLTDHMNRGAYAINLVQSFYKDEKDPALCENRLSILFSVTYDGNSPNPRFEYPVPAPTTFGY